MTWDPVWEQIYRENEWGKYPGEDLIRFIARNFYKIADRSSVRILELGCGTGANLWFIAREGFSVNGIDGSSSAIQRAKERLDTELPNWSGEVRVGDFHQLPYPDNFFDAVIDNEAVYCNSLSDSIDIYKQAHKVLKPNGVFFCRTFAIGSWGDRTGESVGHNAWLTAEGQTAGKGYTRFSSEEDIAQLFEGFSILEKEMISRTFNSGKQHLKEWIIHAKKTEVG